MQMSHRATFLGLLLAAFLLLGGSAVADTLVNQPSTWTATGDSAGQTWASHFGIADGFGFSAFENFTLGQDSSITGFTWRGIYYDYVTETNNPAPPNTLLWNISLYGDDGGIPTVLSLPAYIDYTPVVTSTLLGTATYFDQPVGMYEFSYSFTTPFAATAGTQYWISPLSIAQSFNPLFGWSEGTGVDGNSFQLGTDFSSATFHDNDLALTLTGTTAGGTVPEPSSLVLFGTSLLGLAGVFRRRFAK